jgi:SPP1 gp7 family putative phage head morphogenesis protein
MPEARFDLPPREALEFFRQKGYATSFAWQDVWQQEHDAAFTVAKMMNVDLLRDTKAAVDKAIADGQTFEQFRDELEPRLVQAGWWGKAEMVDPATGEKKLVQLGSARRLRTIFRVNLQAAYQAGHWAQIQQTKAEAPYLMYDAVDDGRTREEHAAWDGTVLPADDPWWDSHMPPNGWNCRCGVIQLSGAQVQQMGMEVAEKAPASPKREYTNPRTGEVTQVPKGIDPGWDYNPGASRVQQVTDALMNKAAEGDATVGARLMKTLSEAEAAAFHSSHEEWVDHVLQDDKPHSSWRIVGGLSVDDLVFLKGRGIAPQSAAITLDSRLMKGTKADRHARSEDALSKGQWRALSRDLMAPTAVLFDKVSRRLHYVLEGDERNPRLVVAIDYGEHRRTLNSVRSAATLNVDALRDRKRFALVRGSV